jgi:hypothetical protein
VLSHDPESRSSGALDGSLNIVTIDMENFPGADLFLSKFSITIHQSFIPIPERIASGVRLKY